MSINCNGRSKIMHLFTVHPYAVQSALRRPSPPLLLAAAMSEERCVSLVICASLDPALRAPRPPSGASQPAARFAMQAWLKRVAAQAKMDYRKTCILNRRLELGQIDEDNLEWWQRENLRKLADGSLLRRTNSAVAAFHRGTLLPLRSALPLAASPASFSTDMPGR